MGQRLRACSLTIRSRDGIPRPLSSPQIANSKPGVAHRRDGFPIGRGHRSGSSSVVLLGNLRGIASGRWFPHSPRPFRAGNGRPRRAWRPPHSRRQAYRSVLRSRLRHGFRAYVADGQLAPSRRFGPMRGRCCCDCPRSRAVSEATEAMKGVRKRVPSDAKVGRSAGSSRGKIRTLAPCLKIPATQRGRNVACFC